MTHEVERTSTRRHRASWLALCVLLMCPLSVNAAELPLIADGYQIFQSVPVRQPGLTGLLQILEDERLTPGLRQDMWRGFNDPKVSLGNLGVGPSDPAYGNFERLPVRPAKIRLVDGDGVTLALRTFDVPLAMIEAETLQFTWPQTRFS